MIQIIGLLSDGREQSILDALDLFTSPFIKCPFPTNPYFKIGHNKERKINIDLYQNIYKPACDFAFT